MKKTILTLLFIATITTLNASQQYQIIGTVTSVFGKATIIRSKYRFKAIPQMNLYNNDRIITDNNSSLVFKMENSNKITINKQTSVKISTIMSKSGNNSRLALIYGTIKAKVDLLLGNNDRIKVRGITATAGVRGTIFSVSASEAPGLLVQVTQGKVILKTKDSSMPVSAGYHATASRKGKLFRKRGIIDVIDWLTGQRLELKGQTMFILMDMQFTINTMLLSLKFDTFAAKAGAFLDDYSSNQPNPTKLSYSKRNRELKNLRAMKAILSKALRQVTTLEIIQYKLQALIKYLGDGHPNLNKLYQVTMSRFKKLKKTIDQIHKTENIYRKRVFLYQKLSNK